MSSAAVKRKRVEEKKESNPAIDYIEKELKEQERCIGVIKHKIEMADRFSVAQADIRDWRRQNPDLDEYIDKIVFKEEYCAPETIRVELERVSSRSKLDMLCEYVHSFLINTETINKRGNMWKRVTSFNRSIYEFMAKIKRNEMPGEVHAKNLVSTRVLLTGYDTMRNFERHVIGALQWINSTSC